MPEPLARPGMGKNTGVVTTQSGSKPGLEPTVSASSALLLSAGPAAEQATGSSTSHSPSFTSSSHFIPMPTLQPTAVPQPSAIIPMSSFQPTPAPQPTAVDLEAQVSRLSAQLLLHQQMLQRGPHPDAVSANLPAQRAIENKYPVV